MSQPPTTNQTGNTVTDGSIIGGNQYTTNITTAKRTKLSSLFEKLKEVCGSNTKVEVISEDLNRFSVSRDSIGLEQKLIDGNRSHIIPDATWLKQEYYKKLTKFQFFEPAQQIHALLLGIVLEKFRNIIYPMIQGGSTDAEISRSVSLEIIDPIMKTIQEEGCDDVMGLSSVDVEGMIYFLTGQCHIKWAKNDSVSPSI
jgi:hypothetical protein